MNDGIANAKIISTSLEVKNDFERKDVVWDIVLYAAGVSNGHFHSIGVEKLCRLLDALTEPNNPPIEWEELPDMHIRVKIKDGEAVAIGHFIEDQWFEK